MNTVKAKKRSIEFIRFNYFDTSEVECLILDEADRMLNMGFYDDIISIEKRLPKKRQNLLFSATMPQKIRNLASNLLVDHESISLAISKPASGILQYAYILHDEQKVKLVRHIIREKGRNISHILIFASSIKSVNKITQNLNKVNTNTNMKMKNQNKKKLILIYICKIMNHKVNLTGNKILLKIMNKNKIIKKCKTIWKKMNI